MNATVRIDTIDDLAAGAAALIGIEPRFAEARDRIGPLRLRRRPHGFAALLSMIVSQQVSVASAASVWSRLEAAGLAAPEPLAAADDDALRACGLSRQKARYARALATAAPDWNALAAADDETAIAALTALPGIGRWTAEIYVMFALGRRDVFAAGDLALQEAARQLFGLPRRPAERDFRAMAARWSPWRSVAACLLWQYYAAVRGREGVTTA